MLYNIGQETGRLHVIHMDVNIQKDVDDARDYVESRLPEYGLWAIVNNADRYDVGFLEWLPVETYETVSRRKMQPLQLVSNFSPHLNPSKTDGMPFLLDDAWFYMTFSARISELIWCHPGDESIFTPRPSEQRENSERFLHPRSSSCSILRCLLYY